MVSDQKIAVSLNFNGDKTVSLQTKDPDYKTLVEVMFKNAPTWSAEYVDGIVTMKPVAGVGKVEHKRDSE